MPSGFNVAGELRRISARRRGAAVAAAVLAHLLFLLGLMWSLGTTPRFYEPPTMSVALVRPWRTETPPPIQARHAAAAGPSQVLPHRPEIASAEAAAPTAALPVPTAPATEAVRNALRGLVGCDHAALAGLSEAERQRCRERLAGARPGDLKDDLGVAPAKRARFAADQAAGKEPLLARTPKNGCHIRVQEEEASAPGLQPRQDWSGGINCAWSF